jgi:hypothetical protein
MIEMNLSWFNFSKPKFQYKPEIRRLTISQHQLVVQHPN